MIGEIDSKRVDRVVNFFEKVLKHTKGDVSGSPFKLLVWQLEQLTEVFGPIDERGLRLIQTVYWEIAKKNAKSEMAAGIALYMLVADGEPAAEVYGAASSRNQAGNVFEAASAMVDSSPILKRRLRIIPSTKTIVKIHDRYSFYKVVSADGGKTDGINPSCSIYDELHRWRGEKAKQLFGVLKQSGMARRQPLNVVITTAGESEAKSPICWPEHEYARRVIAGDIEDRRFHGRIWAADPGDPIDDPKTWAKSNPSLDVNGGYLSSRIFVDMAAAAKNDPAKLIDFKRYHLNLWHQSTERWIQREEWDACGGKLRGLMRRKCYAGFDLSSTQDLTSLVFVFPNDDDTFDVFPYFWMPEENVVKFTERHGVPYAEWIRKGFIKTTPGNVVDHNALKDTLLGHMKDFQIQQVAFDPWNAGQLSIDLHEKHGLEMVPVRQGYGSLSEPTKRVHKVILSRQLRHAENPVLKWNAECTQIRSDDNGNIRPVKPDREKSNQRIDGVVAMIMAFARIPIRTPKKSIFSDPATSVI